jgi:hypothetical protein
MKTTDIPPITPQLWLTNILGVAEAIADKEHQEQRWLAPDAYAWERPEELISSLDDVVLDGFIKNFNLTFSEPQREAAFGFQSAINEYCNATSTCLDPAETLADPRWWSIRQKAEQLIAAFKGTWAPTP